MHRRFELRGEARGAAFFDDYGHTPTEMAVTLGDGAAPRPARLIALLQPHRYSRMQALWRELGESVAGADLVVVTDVYGADRSRSRASRASSSSTGSRRPSPSTRVVYLPHRPDVVAFLATRSARATSS